MNMCDGDEHEVWKDKVEEIGIVQFKIGFK